MSKKFETPQKTRGTKFIDSEAIDKGSSHSDLVKFSFKYLCIDNDLFSFDTRETNYFVSFINRLKSLCCMKCSELKYPTVKALRNHFIDWKDTSQSSFGLPNEEQIVDRPFQFGISANKHGRIIGFFIEPTFDVVWFDPDHNTYS